VSNSFEFDEAANVWGEAVDDYSPPPWRVVAVPEVVTWLDEIKTVDDHVDLVVTKSLLALRASGPLLGRPLADHIKGSNIKNLKELRLLISKDTAFRILFVFDPTRSAVLLVGGNKARQWNRWYVRAIRLAEQRYAQYLDEQKGRRP
jgi:hypothetical protein